MCDKSPKINISRQKSGVEHRMKSLLKNELQGWSRSELLWLITACGIITGLSLYWGDSLMGIISSVTGVACVVCTGKGKLSAYFFGLINCVLYAIISYEAKLYGETMLNAVYYIPMQFVGFFIWKKNINQETKEVTKKKMKLPGLLLTIAAMLAGTIFYGLILKGLGDAMPFVDAFTTVSSVVAMIVSIRMYAEQWLIWVAVNLFSVYMWWCDFMNGSNNLATLLMWAVYLVNAVVMLIKWEKEAAKSSAV